MSGVFRGSEERLQVLIEEWFRSINLPHFSQQEVRGGRVDLMLGLHQEKPDPWCVVEVKTGLSAEGSSVKDLAGHFEQCVKYHMATGLPVFLGPFFTPTMGAIGHLTGGTEVRQATGAFSAFAGRLNVGLFFINAEPGYEDNPAYWYGLRLAMRQNFVADWHKDGGEYHNRWPTEPIKLVNFNGAASKSVRG